MPDVATLVLVAPVGWLFWFVVKVITKMLVDEVVNILDQCLGRTLMWLFKSLMPEPCRHECEAYDLLVEDADQHAKATYPSRLATRLAVVLRQGGSPLLHVPHYWRNNGLNVIDALESLMGTRGLIRWSGLAVSIAFGAISVFGSVQAVRNDEPTSLEQWAADSGVTVFFLGIALIALRRRRRAGAALMWNGAAAGSWAVFTSCCTISDGMRTAFNVVCATTVLIAIAREAAPQHDRAYYTAALAMLPILMAYRYAEVGLERYSVANAISVSILLILAVRMLYVAKVAYVDRGPSVRSR